MLGPMPSLAAGGALPTLDFSTLGWKGFQDLCATVLAEVLGQTFITFAPGPDGGRDGAFRGKWKNDASEMTGAFVVQCKHSSKKSASLTSASLSSEYDKISSLHKRGLANTYVIITNMSITAQAEAAIVDHIRSLGPKHVALYGLQWLSQKVYESSRLRMLVPRLYGIGDLSQILDERAYNQAQALLSSLRDELRRFVPTSAYRRAASAFSKHGFIMLLGEPASGKSSIASVLCLNAIDSGHRHPIKIGHAREFKERWNPHEPTQLFWVDDAFGATQHEPERTRDWNHLMPELRAAIASGARAIFTSRDYIFTEAAEHLKTSAFPLLKTAEVKIKVEDLNLKEKEQILYTHIKLGNQPKSFKKTIKKHLSGLARQPRLLPETARRLGEPLFTKGLAIEPTALAMFAHDPASFLLETFRSMGPGEKGLLAVLFSNGGRIASPMRLAPIDLELAAHFGASSVALNIATKSLQDSVVRRTEDDDGARFIHFRHPTMHDAFGSLLSSNEELLDAYIRGAKIDEILSNATCGKSTRDGDLAVPKYLYPALVARLRDAPRDEAILRRVAWLVAYRSGASFAKVIGELWPNFAAQLASSSTLAWDTTGLRALSVLHEARVLAEVVRKGVVRLLGKTAVDSCNAAFTKIPGLFSDGELKYLENNISTALSTRVSLIVSDRASYFDEYGNESPTDHFEWLRNQLSDLSTFFEKRGAQSISEAFLDGVRQIDGAVESMEWNNLADEDTAASGPSSKDQRLESSEGRDRFDDLDD